MKAGALRRGVPALLLVLASACAGAADGDARARTSAPAIATPEEVAADPAGVWKRFLDKADIDSAFDAYDVIDAVGATADGVDADLCRAQAAALREAVTIAPVSISVHRAALRCAEATGDNATAEREAAAIAALSKHALAGAGGSAWQKPILVLSPRDVYALIALLGYEFSYEYYRDVHPKRYFPMVVAAWDADAKVERHLCFDFVDATARISRGETYSGYPFQRDVMATVFVNAQVKGDEVIGRDLQAVKDSLLQEDVRARVAKLREGAAHGGLLSLSSWIMLCRNTKDSDCADGLIDTLLPLAEKKRAMPMMLLAMAYADGIGVKRDFKAANALLDAADRAWSGQGASAMFAATDSVVRGGTVSDFAMARLRKAANAGSADAQMLLIVVTLGGKNRPALTETEIAVLQRPSSNGMGLGYVTLGEYYAQRGMTQRRDEAFRKAAELGHPGSQRALAVMAMREKADPARWRPMLEDAAQGGDVFAMRRLAYEAATRSDWKRADAWLLSAVEAGDREAAYDLASVYETGSQGLSGGVANAVETYETLAAGDDETATRARRRLALLARDGHGMKQSIKRARQWLLADAERGDIAAQALLGGLLLRSDGTAEQDVAAAETWFRKAIQGGSNVARSEYGMWLYTSGAASESRRRSGIEILRAVDPESEDHLVVENNLAWVQCVSPYPDVRDPAAGLVVAKSMERDPDLDPGMTDTVAACYAATGDFASAARLQQRAIEGQRGDADDKAQDNAGMRDRLALYRAGKAYIEAAP